MLRALSPGRASLARPAVLTLTLLGPVVYFLLQSVPGRLEQPLATPVLGAHTRMARLIGAPQGSGADRSIVYRLKLTAKDVGRIVSHARIELLTTTDRADLLLRAGEIRIGGADCRYRAAAGTPYPVNDFLPFVRGSGCVPLTGGATGELELTVTLAEIAPLDVLTFEMPMDAPPESTTIIVAAPSASAAHLYSVRGRFVDPYPARSAPRVQLLNHVWQVSSSSRWIWMLLALAGVLLAFGHAFFWTNPVADGRWTATLRALAGASLAAALGLTYAIVTPPFHAPDEPAHFIGFNRFLGRPEMYVEASHWAQATHFERIQFHVLEKFGPFDMERGGPPWDEGQAPDPNIRGGGVFYVWGTLAYPFRHLPAPELLFILRSINATVFGLVIGCFVLAVQRLADVRRPHLLVVPLFLVPTLPFFAMHVSNHAALVCTYIVVGLGVVVWFLGGSRSAASGLIIGIGWAAGLLLSRSAIPLAPLVAAVFAGRLLLGGSDPGWRSTMLFWAGGALPPLAMTLADAEYLRTLAGFGGAAGAGGLTNAIVRLVAQPWLVIFVVAAAAALERLLASVRTRASSSQQTFARRLTGGMMAVGAMAVVALVALSVFVQFPTVQRIDQMQPPPASAYVPNAVLATLTMFRVSRPDFFTSMSFWGGFGWLETQPDWRFVCALVLATAASFVALLLRIRRAGDALMSARLALTLGGFALAIAAYAYTLVRLLPADLVGRYVYGAYLAMLLVCWTPIAGLSDDSNGRSRAAATWILALACMVVHAYCLTAILRRYF